MSLLAFLSSISKPWSGSWPVSLSSENPRRGKSRRNSLLNKINEIFSCCKSFLFPFTQGNHLGNSQFISRIRVWHHKLPFELIICDVRVRTLESVQQYLCAKTVSYKTWMTRAYSSSLPRGYTASQDNKCGWVTAGQIAQQTHRNWDPLIQISTGRLVSSLTKRSLQSYHEIMEKLFHVNKLPLESYGAGTNGAHNREGSQPNTTALGSR